MKTSIVPAQITTVEDKIAANLSPQQLLMLSVPLVFGVLSFIILPPSITVTPYKIVLTVLLGIVAATLAIRIKGKLLLFWFLIRLRYNLRPRYYVFRKQSAYLRTPPQDVPQARAQAEERTVQTKPAIDAPHLSVADIVKVEEFMTNPDAKIRFMKGKDGKLNVVFQEVQQ